MAAARRKKHVETKPEVKKKRKIGNGFWWLILVVAAGLFFVTFYKLPMFPTNYSYILGVCLLIVLVITRMFTSLFSPHNRFQKFINLLLSIALFVGSAIMPYYTSKIEELIASATGTTVKIHLYAMTNEYKESHVGSFNNTITVPSDRSKVNILDYKNAVFGTMSEVDVENQSYAANELKNLLGGEYTTLDASSLDRAVGALYQNHVDIMIMSESYASMISDLDGYESFDTDTQILYTIERTIESGILKSNDELTKKPFTIFFGGNDSTGDLSLVGRTDVDMIVTVNPNTHQIAIINMPRDSYIPNPAYNNSYDKLTHLGLSGLDNTLTGLGNYLDVDINQYVLVNFDTFMVIIDSLGGVVINNPYAFTAIDGQHFEEGDIFLDAGRALMYVRERKNLINGDFDRNMHQQIVMEAIINKITSVEGITKFNSILNGLQGMFLTNVTTDGIYGLVNKQLSENIDWNIVKYHVTGEFGTEPCAAAGGQQLSIVYPYTNQIKFLQKVIDDVIAGEIVTQEELPEGSYGEE